MSIMYEVQPMPVLLSFLLGIFSMGFQLLGSRLLNPWFGSSIIVWAFIISFFLAAFSLGSILGGLLARLSGHWKDRWLLVVAGVAVMAFAFNAVFARALLAWLDHWSAPLPVLLGLTCGVLFLPPVCALAALTPLLIQRLSENGMTAGFASGVIYCTGTLGNIAGIMLTVFLLIPHFPVSVLLWFWTAGVAVTAIFVLRCLRG